MDNARFNPSLRRLNAIRCLIVIMIGFGYASTMPRGPQTQEWGAHLGHDPSWFGIQVLFFLSGWLGWRTLQNGGTLTTYLTSRAKRTYPWVLLYTCAVLFFAYPWLAASDGNSSPPIGPGALYFLKTITLLDPGGPLQGVLDQSPYNGLLQGAIWTLRWGLVIHIGFAIYFGVIGKNRTILTGLTAFTIAIYAALFWFGAKGAVNLPASAFLFFRLGYPFLLGACLLSWSDRVQPSPIACLALATAAFGIAAAHDFALPWTPAIEILGTVGWAAVAMALLAPWASGDSNSLLDGWPNVILPTYLGLWPLCQIWLHLIPSLPIPALILLTLGSATLLALLLHTVVGALFRRHGRVQSA